jgi:16S rRNA (cytosine967-C5)-methyltransferase
VQDCTARAAADALQAQPGERVLDLCAAPGGKSLALAIAMRDQGRVVACDTDATRLARVGENVGRLGLTSVEMRVLAGDAAAALAELPPFDAALVDVPARTPG